MENQTEERAGGEASGGGGGGGGDQDGLVHTPTTVLVDAELSVDEIGATISFKGLPTDVPQAKLCTFERHSDVSETVHEGAFSTTSYLSFLRTERLGRALLYSECTRSTQDMLGEANGDETFRSRLELLKWKRGSEVDIAPLLCLADRQTKGRGRGGNTWSSPLGCLLFSYSSRFRGLAEERLPFFQYLVSIALVRAATTVATAAKVAAANAVSADPEAASAVRSSADLDIAIKWPNDIYANARRRSRIGASDGATSTSTVGAAAAAAGAAADARAASTRTSSSSSSPPMAHKIGGILCQSSFDYKSKTFDVITGVGFNVENETPTTCLRRLVVDAVTAKLPEHTAPPTTSQASPFSSSSMEVATRATATAAVEATVTRERFLAEFLSEFEEMYAVFTSSTSINAKATMKTKEGSISPGHAFHPFLSEYLSLWLHAGQEVSVSADSLRESSGGGAKDGRKDETTAMVVDGLSHTGALLARLQGCSGPGSQYELMPDGNSFDFFRGLIVKKV